MARKTTVNSTLKFMLTICSVWPGTPYVLFCKIYWIVTVTINLYCLSLYFVTHVRTAGILNLADCASSFLAYCKVIIKFIIFWLNQRKFVEILEMMTEDWSDCVNDDVSMRETVRKAKISDRITNTFIILHAMTIFSVCFGILLADADVNDDTKELPFLNKLNIPFEINRQNTYRFVLIVEFLVMILYGLAAGITNSLLLTLILHTAGQIEIMRNWLSQLVPRKSEGKRGSISIMTTKIIQKHQRIIRFSENIESLYTHIALVQFVSNSIIICLLGFLIVTAIGSPNAVEQIVKTFLFYTITNIEAFVFCFAGEYLSNKSKEIGLEVYNSSWYNLKCNDSRILLFIILRSQKQLTLTAGKIVDLSLQSFTSIMNASGSYLSMLLALQ